MLDNRKTSRTKFFNANFSRSDRDKRYYQLKVELEKLEKNNLEINPDLKKRAQAIKEDLDILREISLEEESSNWKS